MSEGMNIMNEEELVLTDDKSGGVDENCRNWIRLSDGWCIRSGMTNEKIGMKNSSKIIVHST